MNNFITTSLQSYVPLYTFTILSRPLLFTSFLRFLPLDTFTLPVPSVRFVSPGPHLFLNFKTNFCLKLFLRHTVPSLSFSKHHSFILKFSRDGDLSTLKSTQVKIYVQKKSIVKTIRVYYNRQD